MTRKNIIVPAASSPDMGVNLKDLLVIQKTTIQRFTGKTLLVDSYNILYQFRAGMRQADGSLLRDSQNRVTSHLNGLFFRTINLMKDGLKMAFIFDGKPHRFKHETIKGRIAVKEKAREEWKTALEEGDLEKARSQAQRTSRITRDMLGEAKYLLKLLGLPYVEAPSEGEAQASYMNNNGDAFAVVSQDFDSILFGATYVARNLTLSGKRKLPSKRVWVNVSPELIDSMDTFAQLGVTREQLVDIALMVGTDFNQGIHGIGPKKGLKLIKKHGDLESVLKERGEEMEDIDELRSIFLEPEATDDYNLVWNELDRDGIIKFMCDEHDFSQHRIENELNKLEAGKERRAQKTLDFF